MSPSDNNVHIHISDLIASTQSASTETEIYQCAALALSHIIDADRASVALLNTEENTLELLALSGFGSVFPRGTKLPLYSSLVGKAVLTRQGTIWTPDINSELVDSKGLAKDGFRSVMNAPLITRDSVIGSLNTGSKKANAYTTEHLELLHRIASLIAIQVDRQRLFDRTLSSATRFKNYSQRLELINSIGQRPVDSPERVRCI